MPKPSPHSLLTARRRPTREEVFTGLLPGFGSAADTRSHSKLLCERLAKGNKRQRKLGKRIRRCREDRPCGSGASLLCLRKARMQLIPQASNQLQAVLMELNAGAKVKADRHRLWAVSAVDYRQAVPRGSLDAGAVHRKSETVAKAIRRALPGTVAFAGVDIGLNFPMPKGSPPEWQPQLYFVIVARSDEEVRKVLKPHFPRRPGTNERPITVTEVKTKNIASAVSYAFKSRFTRRISYGGHNGRNQTRKVSLKPDETTELAVFLDELGFKDRLLLLGLKIIKGQLLRT